MTDKQLQNFVSYLIKNNYKVFSHKETAGEVLIDEIREGKNFELCPKRPLYSFKKFFLPPCQKMMEFKGGVTTLNKSQNIKTVLLGLHFYDLKALTLLNQVFNKDPHFQKKLRNIIVIGQIPVPSEKEDYIKFEKEILEHMKFDIFLEAKYHEAQQSFRIFTGSEDGQRLLDDFGYKDYENIEYVGPRPKKGLDLMNSELIEKIPKSRGSKLWDELDKKCIDCGKCAIVCPTCFCFKITDEIQKDKIVRYREWDTCFYEEFSEIAGAHKFLDSTKKRIYNYYDHKFVRIPKEFGMQGCVGCGRCTEVCPAGIDIKENIKRIIREN